MTSKACSNSSTNSEAAARRCSRHQESVWRAWCSASLVINSEYGGTSRSSPVALSELCDYVLRRSGFSKANVVLGSVERVVELLAACVIEFVGIEGYQASQ
jgi:hypothetical protein